MIEPLKYSLRKSYDNRAAERDGNPISSWKAAERRKFLELLLAEGRHSLLELGAGPGRDGQFFQENGLDVTCTDLSPEMVARCRQKGLTAHVMDMANLSFEPQSLDAAYAFNSLLHLPKHDLPGVLDEIRGVLAPDGLFFMGVYGGRDFEGVWEEDFYRPRRFFSFHIDQAMAEIVSSHFEVVSFDVIETDEKDGLHFQSMVLRK